LNFENPKNDILVEGGALFSGNTAQGRMSNGCPALGGVKMGVIDGLWENEFTGGSYFLEA
jgi:hypothetical protein